MTKIAVKELSETGFNSFKHFLKQRYIALLNVNWRKRPCIYRNHSATFLWLLAARLWVRECVYRVILKKVSIGIFRINLVSKIKRTILLILCKTKTKGYIWASFQNHQIWKRATSAKKVMNSASWVKWWRFNYWAVRSSARSFARTAHWFASSALFT